MELTSLLCVTTVLSFLYFAINSIWKRGSNIPGPTGYPFVGNVFDVDLDRMYIQFHRWSKIYGDIFKIKFFGQTFVSINSSVMLRELFCKEPYATLTSARPKSFLQKYMFNDVDVAFTSLDKKWIQRRKVMHKLLNSYGDGLQYLEEQVTTKLSEFRQEMSESKQIRCDPRDLVDDFVLTILEILMIGKNSGRGSEFQRYIAVLNETGNTFVDLGVNALYTNLPFLRFLPLSYTKKYNIFISLRDGLLEFLERQSGNSSVGIYHSMKQLLHSDTETWFTESVMESMLLNIQGAGFITTRGMLLYLIRILMSLPDVQQKLQQEVDRVIGHNRHPTLKDRYDMPYCEAVILETLRYTSHVPLSLAHSAAQDITIGNFTIPKHALIIPNLWTMQHSESEWKDPFQFHPERFLTEDGELLPADHEIRKRFVAFGNGRRSCIGEVLAKSRIFLFICTLMQVSTVLPPDGKKVPLPEEKDLVPGVVLYPLPYMCKFKHREV